MIRATIEFAQSEKIPPASFEFQMLYGVRRDLQQKLVKEGWRCRVYIPFGTEWYPYLMRRLAERPANAIFILKNLFR
jgi:proline dehydrogenase